ncbi:hypothetical protein H4R34_005034 [Dimargaris verticillata]|uniref:Uncharacterized protein n=1 Tax=Dimargaris verticillata TaxID=2761393 RepID=A0A9W8B317_9FUNG|nr:hypothetical protein H4R34_005034 [Dimargaris verticillata]
MYVPSATLLLFLLCSQSLALPAQKLAGSNPFADSSEHTSLSSIELQGQNAIDQQTLTLGEVCQNIQSNVDQGQGGFAGDLTAPQLPPPVHSRNGPGNDNEPTCSQEPNMAFFQAHCQDPSRRHEEVVIRMGELPRTSEDSQRTAVNFNYAPGEPYDPELYDINDSSLAQVDHTRRPFGLISKAWNSISPQKQFSCMIFTVASVAVSAILGYVIWPTTHGGHY